MKTFWRFISCGFAARNRWRLGTDAMKLYPLITNRAPPNVPEAFWRSIGGLKWVLRVTMLLLLLCAIVCFGGLFFRGTGGIHPLQEYSLSCLAAVIVLYAFAGMFGFRIALGRFERFLIGHSWFVCSHCGYALDGLPAQHRCPECGLAYDRRQLAALWRAWIDRNIVYSGTEQPPIAGADTGRLDTESYTGRNNTGR